MISTHREEDQAGCLTCQYKVCDECESVNPVNECIVCGGCNNCCLCDDETKEIFWEEVEY